MTFSSPSRTGQSHEAGGGDGYLLQSEADLDEAVSYAIARGMALGATGATAFVNESGGIHVSVTGGAVEKAVRNGNQQIRVTLFHNGRTGEASSESLGRQAIDRVVEQAMAMARQLEPDPEAGLADHDSLGWDTPAVPLFAPSEATAAELTEAALEIEREALSAPSQDTVRVSEAGAASRDMRFAFATSHGFCRSGSGSMQERWCQTIAQRGSDMKQGFWSSVDRRCEGLDGPARVGQRAAGISLGMLGAAGLTTRRAPVLVDATVAASLVRDMCAQLTGTAQFQRNTFLPDAEGQVIAAAHLSLTEDPFEPYGLASSTFDSEGVSGKRRDVIQDGVVQGLFLDTRMARKLGKRSTGNAGGMRNLVLTSSLTTPADNLDALLRKMGTGLWLTRFMGGGTNPATGAYSRAAEGFWIENGEVTAPVHGFTIAGNLRDMLQAVAAVGHDVHRAGGIRTGSILLPDMQIAGR